MILYRVFIIYIVSQLLLGCGGYGSTTGKIYNKVFSEKQEVNCPKARFIKGINELKKGNEDGKLLYIVTFSELEWNCYINKGKKNQNYNIELNIGFQFISEDKKYENKIENFEYVIALLDPYERLVFTKKYSYNLDSDKGLLNFSKENRENILIKIDIEKIKSLYESTLLFGFIK